MFTLGGKAWCHLLESPVVTGVHEDLGTIHAFWISCRNCDQQSMPLSWALPAFRNFFWLPKQVALAPSLVGISGKPWIYPRRYFLNSQTYLERLFCVVSECESSGSLGDAWCDALILSSLRHVATLSLLSTRTVSFSSCYPWWLCAWDMTDANTFAGRVMTWSDVVDRLPALVFTCW